MCTQPILPNTFTFTLSQTQAHSMTQASRMCLLPARRSSASSRHEITWIRWWLSVWPEKIDPLGWVLLPTPQCAHRYRHTTDKRQMYTNHPQPTLWHIAPNPKQSQGSIYLAVYLWLIRALHPVAHPQNKSYICRLMAQYSNVWCLMSASMDLYMYSRF